MRTPELLLGALTHYDENQVELHAISIARDIDGATPNPRKPSASRYRVGVQTAHPPTHPFRVVWTFAVAKLAGNTLLRFPYLFATPIAAGLNLDIAALTAILGLRELGGLASGIFARLSDSGRARLALVVAGLGTALTHALAPLGSRAWFFGVCLTLGATMKTGFDVVQLSWIGHHLGHRDRSKATAIIETSWASALLIAAPIVGFIIDRNGWAWGFLAVAGVMAVLSLGAAGAIGPDGHGEVARGDNHDHPQRGRWFQVGVLAYCFFQPLAQMMIFGTYGDWFAVHFGMTSARIGTASIALGGAEIAATAATIWFIKAFGDLSAARLGMLIAVPAAASLGFGSPSFGFTLGMIFLADVGFELSFVTALSFLSDMDPARRARAVAMGFVVITLARSSGSAIAGVLYEHGGFAWAGRSSAIFSACAAVSLACAAHHPKPA